MAPQEGVHPVLGGTGFVGKDTVHGSGQTEVLFRLGPRDARLVCLARNRLIEFAQILQVLDPFVEGGQLFLEGTEGEFRLEAAGRVFRWRYSYSCRKEAVQLHGEGRNRGARQPPARPVDSVLGKVLALRLAVDFDRFSGPSTSQHSFTLALA